MIPTREVNGKFYRFLTPKWAHRPTSGDGAIGEGGRFNPKGVPTLYLSADYATAWDEYNQPGRPLKPGTLVVYDVKASQIVDLTDPKVVEACRVSENDLACNWLKIVEIENKTPPTWDLARRLITVGYNGVLARSVLRRSGVNLALWYPEQAEGMTATPHDPYHDLPKNQISWK
ncbi:MAG: RES family NAD+ phosphorylase [Alphaproteobacteria bacterium]